MKKIGLALGGGGARGCAHVGIIKALLENNIPIHYIAGTSIGAVVGGVYAAGYIEEFEDYLCQIKWRDVLKTFDPTLPKHGLLKGEKAMELFHGFIKRNHFHQTHIPFTAIATDIQTAQEVRLHDGNILNAIRASISIPGIFVPVKIDGRFLVDGGVVNPLPVNVVQEMGADFVIAVDLNHGRMALKIPRKMDKSKPHDVEKKSLLPFLNHPDLSHLFESKKHHSKAKNKAKSKSSKIFSPKAPGMMEVLHNSIFMMQDQITKKNLMYYRPDVLIRPQLKPTNLFDFHKAKEMMEEGYAIGKKFIPQIKEQLNKRRKKQWV